MSRDCAKVAGIDWEGSGIAECVAGEEGKRLLKESIERTRELGIRSVQLLDLLPAIQTWTCVYSSTFATSEVAAR